MTVVRFEPRGVEAAAAPGDTLFALARALGVPIATSCTGNGNCGLCGVTVLEGGGALCPPTEVEVRALGATLARGQRLSCQAALLAGADEQTVRVQVGVLRKL